MKQGSLFIFVAILFCFSVGFISQNQTAVAQQPKGILSSGKSSIEGALDAEAQAKRPTRPVKRVSMLNTGTELSSDLLLEPAPAPSDRSLPNSRDRSPQNPASVSGSAYSRSDVLKSLHQSMSPVNSPQQGKRSISAPFACIGQLRKVFSLTSRPLPARIFQPKTV